MFALAVYFTIREYQAGQHGWAALHAAEIVVPGGSLVGFIEFYAHGAFIRAQQEVTNENWRQENQLPPGRPSPF
jgi:hypothetical protein